MRAACTRMQRRAATPRHVARAKRTHAHVYLCGTRAHYAPRRWRSRATSAVVDNDGNFRAMLAWKYFAGILDRADILRQMHIIKHSNRERA